MKFWDFVHSTKRLIARLRGELSDILRRFMHLCQQWGASVTNAELLCATNYLLRG